MDRYDLIIFLGLALLVFAVIWLAGWPGLVGLVGVILIIIGVWGAGRDGNPA